MTVLNNLKTYEPFADMVRTPMFDWAGLFDMPRTRFALPTLRGEPDIRMDVTEDANAYRVKAEIPGVKKEDIHVTVEGNQVTIAAEVKKESEEKDGERRLRSERYFGAVYRSFVLPVELDETASEAKYENGVLELKLAKKPALAGRKLTIQ